MQGLARPSDAPLDPAVDLVASNSREWRAGLVESSAAIHGHPPVAIDYRAYRVPAPPLPQQLVANDEKSEANEFGNGLDTSTVRITPDHHRSTTRQSEDSPDYVVIALADLASIANAEDHFLVYFYGSHRPIPSTYPLGTSSSATIATASSARRG